MRLIEKRRESADVEITSDELMIVNNALNEILNGVSISGFHPRIGADRSEVQRLLNEVGAIKTSLTSSADSP